MPLRRVLNRVPSIVAEEAFTAADATAITALARPWTKNTAVSNNTAAPTVIANRLVGENAATTSLYYRDDWQSASPDYRVEADVVQRSSATNGGVVARMTPAVNTYYSARFTPGVGWRLYKQVAGVQTQLGSTVAQTLTTDVPYRLALDIQGTILTVLVNGAVIISTADSSITAAGRAGIIIIGAETATVGVHIDTWQVVQ